MMNGRQLRYLVLWVLIPSASCSLQAQQNWIQYHDSCWVDLEATFEASDDLLDVWPKLQALDAVSEKQDFAAFLDRAIPFVKDCYEYGFFEGSSTYLLRLDSILTSNEFPPETSNYRCDILYHLGRLNFFAQEPTVAQSYTKRCISCAISAGKVPVWEYNLLGAISQDLNQLDSAAFYYRKALSNGSQLPDFGEGVQGSIKSNLGIILYDSGLTKAAVEQYEEALELKRRAMGPDHVQVAVTLINIGNCKDDLGLFAEAIESYEEALRILILNDLSDADITADLYLNLGVTEKKNSAYAEALRYYQRARTLYEQQATPSLTKLALVNSNMALVYANQKDYQTAIRYHEYSLAQNKAIENTFGIADNYANLGFVAGQMGDWSVAKSYYLQALQMRQTLPEVKADLAIDFINLADAHLALGEYLEASIQSTTAEAMQMALLGERSPERAYALSTQARIARADGKLGEALNYAQESLKANHQSFDSSALDAMPNLEGYFRYDFLLESLLLKAALLREGAQETNNNQDRELAQAHYQHALSLLDRVSRELSSREDQITLAYNVYRTASAAVTGCYELYESSGEAKWIDQAFQLSERTKANVLHAAITANEAQHFAGIPDELPEREASLQADIGYYKRQLATVTDSLERLEAEANLFESQEAYNELIEHYQENYPAYYELRHEQQLPSLRAVQFALPEDQLVVSYFTTDTHLYRFEISKTNSALVSQPLPRRFASDIRGFNKGIVRQMDRVYLRKAQQLGKLLLPEAIAENIEELILVPDGLLLQLPFEALLTGEVSGEEIDYGTLPYLIKDFQVQYAPSVSLYNQTQATTLNLELSEVNGLLAYAPVFPGATAIQEATRSNPFAGENILPLPETEREVSQLARLFLENGREAQTYLYHSANEHALKESELGKYRYLHVATHGFVNEAEPDLSGLLLYPDSTAGEDGLLAVGEVYNLSLNAELVTLSACETGIGQIASGEGVLGFTRAFLYAGAERVLVSLWQVQDAATADLITAFYQELLEVESPNYSTQLRAAKLKLIESERFSHPYYWSPFILLRG